MMYVEQHSGIDQLPGPADHVVITLQERQEEPLGYLSADKCNSVKRISISQMVIGVICIFLGIGICCIPPRLYRQITNSAIGTGIWVGLLFVITGIVGLAAASRNVSKKVVAAAVMNILCACGGGVLSLFAAFDMAINQLCSSKSLLTTTIQQPTTTWHWSDDATPTTTPEIIPTFGEETTRFDEEHYRICLRPEATNILFALNALNALMGLIQIPLAIYCAVICCRAVPGCCDCCGVSEPPYITQFDTSQGTVQSGLYASQLSSMPSDIGSVSTDLHSQSNTQPHEQCQEAL